jgi:hypothetical protein
MWMSIVLKHFEDLSLNVVCSVLEIFMVVNRR